MDLTKKYVLFPCTPTAYLCRYKDGYLLMLQNLEEQKRVTKELHSLLVTRIHEEKLMCAMNSPMSHNKEDQLATELACLLHGAFKLMASCPQGGDRAEYAMFLRNTFEPYNTFCGELIK